MIYGNTYFTNEENMNEAKAATIALGDVLSTPAGTIMLGMLYDNERYSKYRRDEYEAFVIAGKRPSKSREYAFGAMQRYEGERGGIMDAMVIAVQQAANWTIRRRFARNAINYELEQMNDTKLYIKCLSLTYND